MLNYPGVPIDQNAIPSNVNQLIAQGPPNVLNLNDVVNDYEKGEQSGYQTRNQNVFQNGLPTNPDGSVNWAAAVQQVVQAGGTPGLAAAGPLIKAQILSQADQYSPVPGDGSATGAQPAPSSSSSQIPPSTAGGPRPQTTDQSLTPSQVASANPSGVPQQSATPQTTPRALSQQTGVDAGAIANAAGVGLDDPIPQQARAAVVNLLRSSPPGSPTGATPQPQVQQPQAPQVQQPQTPNTTVVAQGSQPVPQQGSPVAGDFQAQIGDLQRQQQVWQARGDAYTRRAGLRDAIEPGSGKADEQAAEDAYKKAQQIQQSILQIQQPTPEGKNARDTAVSGYEQNKAAATQFATDDAKSFSTRADGIETLGENAQNGLQRIQLMKGLIQSPGFYSGPLNEGVESYNQFKSVFGGAPTSALPQEAFNKNVNDILREQIQAMGKSGVGRVLQAEVRIMQQGIASLGITPASNRAQLTMLGRVYGQEQDLAGIAQQVRQAVASGQIAPGQYNAALNAQVQKYYQDPAHHLVSQDEVQDPARLAAVDAPPASANWTPQQKQAWAVQQGLRGGDYVRFNGQYIQLH